MICGNLLSKSKKKIIGISNARKNPRGSDIILDSVNEYLKETVNYMADKDDVIFKDDYILSGYGSYNKPIISTIKKLLISEGLPLDATYTGKGFYGMEKYLENNNLKDKKVLFIHTGGTPLLFDDLEELFNE